MKTLFKQNIHVLFILSALLFQFAGTVMAQPGSLDLSFGTNGIVITPGPAGYSSTNALAIVVQPDGKIVGTGFTYNSVTNTQDYCTVRYNTDGTPDIGFGTNGMVITSVNTHDDYGKALAVQSGGKIVVAGSSSFNGSNFEIALVRYTTAGALDPTFGSAGLTTLRLGVTCHPTDIKIQGDGKIVISGYAFNGSFNYFVCARFSQDGVPDGTFGTSGIVSTPINLVDDEANALLIQPDGKIVLAGWSFDSTPKDDFALVRYNTDGILDNTFGSSGKVIAPIGAGFDYGYAVAIQPDGKILVGGYSINANNDFSLARFNTDGTPDVSFGTGGIVITAVGPGDEEAYSLAVQADGKILLSGNSANGAFGSDVALCRYNSDGSSDITFGLNGIVKTSIGTSNDYALGMVLQPADGKILVAGNTFSSVYQILVMRYNVNAPAPCSNSTLPFTEGFNASLIPDCWTQQFVSGTESFTFPVVSTGSPAPGPAEGTHQVMYSSFFSSSTRLVSPPITTSGTLSVDVQFQWFFSNMGDESEYQTEGLQLQFSTDGITWIDAGSFIRRYGPVTGWSLQTITLPECAADQPILYIGFLVSGNGGYDCFMDAVLVHETPPTGYYRSVASGNWSTMATWEYSTDGSGGWITPVAEPACTDNVLIRNPHSVTIDGSYSYSRDLTVETGAVLTIDPPNSITVCRVLTNTVNTGLVIRSNASGTGSIIAGNPANLTVESYLTGSTTEWRLISAPLSGQGIYDFVTAVANDIAFIAPKYGLAPYVNTIPGWKNFNTIALDPYNAASAGPFPICKGYEVLRNTNGVVTFAGTLVTSGQAMPLTTPAAPGNNWNLVGNPFASAINAANFGDNFLDVNATILDPENVALYTWNGSSYDVINYLSGIRKIQLGQGFFVKPMDGEPFVYFTAVMRTANSGGTTKNTENAWPQINLKADISGTSRNTGVYFVNGSTKGLDPGYDAGVFDGNSSNNSIYTHIEGIETGFGIQSLPNNMDNDVTISVGLNAAAATTVTFTAETMNLPAGLKVFLHDVTAGTFTRLDTPGSSYQVTLTAASKGIGRFYIITSKNSLGTGTPSGEELYTVIPVPSENKIRLTGSFAKGSQVTICSMNGQVLYTGKLQNSSDNEIRFAPAVSGIYLLRLQCGTKVINRKIAWVY